MEIFAYLALSIAVFLQFIPLQLTKEIKGFEIVHRDKDGLVESRIGVNFVRNKQVEADVDSIPISRNLPQSRINNSSMQCIDNFCENVPNYPQDEINFAVKNRSIKAFTTVQGDTSMLKVETRQYFGYMGLCNANYRFVTPHYVTNMHNKSKYIVQNDQIKQSVVLTTCGFTQNCGQAVFPLGTEARCTQRYSWVRLLAVDTSDGGYWSEETKPKYDTFPFSSCCECTFFKP